MRIKSAVEILLGRNRVALLVYTSFFKRYLVTTHWTRDLEVGSRFRVEVRRRNRTALSVVVFRKVAPLLDMSHYVHSLISVT